MILKKQFRDFFQKSALNMVGVFCLSLLLLFSPIEGKCTNEKISIQLKWFHQFQFAGYYAAKEKGYFKEEGLDVTLLQRDPSTSYIDDVLEKKAQYGVADAGLVLSRLQGKPVVLLSQIFQHSPLVLLVMKESGIRTPYDLAGKTIMADLKGNSDAPLNAMLLKTLGGLDSIAIKPNTYKNEDLLKGKVDVMDAYLTDQPYWFEERDKQVTVLDPRDYGIDFYGDNLFTTQEEIDKHPKRVQKVIRAVTKGWAYALEHPEEIVDLILVKYDTRNLSKEHMLFEAVQTKNIILPQFVDIGSFERPRFNKMAEIYALLGFAEHSKLDEGFIYSNTNDIDSSLGLTNEEKEWLEKHPSVRLGVDPSWPPFDFIDKEGEHSGVIADIIRKLEQRLDLKFELQSGLTWSDVKAGAKSKEIDVISLASKTKERKEYLNWTDPVITMPLVIANKVGSKGIQGIKDLKGQKILVVKGYAVVSKLKEKYPDITFIEVPSSLDALQKLSFSQADAYIGYLGTITHLIKEHGLYNLQIAAPTDFPPRKISIAVRKDWPLLISILNKALLNIPYKEQQDIRRKWFSGEKNKENINLTNEEKKWIEENTVLVGVEQWAPVVFSNTGKDIDGITGDVLKLVAKNLGLKIEIINDLWDPLLTGLKDRKIDLLPATYYTDKRASYGLYTDGYYKMLDYIYVKEENNHIKSMEDLKGKRLAIIKGFGTIPKVRERFPQIKIVETVDLADSIRRVLIGEVDALFEGQIAVEYKIQEDLITGLKGIPQRSFEAGELYFFVRNDKPILQSILQKGLQSVSREELNKIKSKWILNHKIKKSNNEEVNTSVSFVGLLTLEEIMFALIIASLLGYLGYIYYKKSNLLSMRFKTFNIVIISFELSIISFLVFEIVTLDRTENALVKTQVDKISMLKVADELRQSSDDLTHAARSYVVTNDIRFEKRYLEILKIRNGKKARPENYEGIYWDLDKKTREKRHPGEKKVSLRSMFESLPFTKEELAKLKESEDKANVLVDLEVRAFEAMKDSNQRLAIKLLHSDEYYKEKHNIMLPIDEILSMLNKRTDNQIKHLEQKVSNQFIYILIIGILFILGNIVIYILLRKKVNIPIEYLTTTIGKIQRNEKNIEKKAFYDDEIGETIEQFFVMQRQIENKAKDLKEQKEFVQTLLDSQDQLIITTNGEELKSVNKTFLEFFKVSSEKEFKNKFCVSGVCESFNNTLSKEYLQTEINGQNWIDYIIKRPNQIHKVAINIEGKDNIFSVTAAELPSQEENLRSVVFTNITELEKVKNDIELILSNIMLPILITSKKERKILYANRYSEQQYGISMDQLVGSDIDIVYSEKGQGGHLRDELERNGKVENIEEKFKKSNGENFTGLLSVSHITYQGEDAYIGMVVDITKQKNIEEEIRMIHKQTKDSIEYASLIQGSLIPDNELFRKYFKEYFAIWHPKDIVGGDIYLFDELRNEDECLLMVIDCTGHGVPGAFVTMLVKAIERQIISYIVSEDKLEVSAAWCLEYFNKNMKKLLQQENRESISNAGFDGQVLYYNKKENIIKFASARNELFYLQNDEVYTIKGDRHSVGYKDSNPDYKFKEHIIDVSIPTSFYLSSDGLIDQLGGEKELPFGKKRLKRIIDEMKDESMAEQQEEFIYELYEYQGDMDRQDDVTLIGFKV